MTGARFRTGDTPYPGTRPFGRDDHARFFGRKKQSDILANFWRVNRLTVAMGPAGIGKTSLLQAGVLPLVAEEQVDVLPPGRLSYGATFPWAALPSENPYSIALLRSWSPATPPTRLARLTISDFIAHRAERHDSPILAVIDQAEELLGDSGPRWGHRRRFLAALRTALREQTRLHLLLVVRDEASTPICNALGQGACHQIGPLSTGEAIDAVTGPLPGTGRNFGPGAAAGLVADLQTRHTIDADGTEQAVASEFVEPALLQVACTHLWRSLPADLDVITSRDVRRYGNVSTGLAAHCGRVIATVADEHDIPPSRLHRWLLKTFVTRNSRRADTYEGPGVTAGMTNAVVRALEDRHLLRASQRSGQRWYELLGERLIKPLRDAVTELPAGPPPAYYLRAAERELSFSDLDSAERYAQLTLRTLGDADLRLQAEASSLLGNVAYEREKPNDAAQWYRKAAEAFGAAGDSSAVAYQLAAVGQTLIDQGQLAEARDQLLKAADRGPDDPVLQTGLARALWGLGEGRTAVAILNGPLSIDAGNREALGTRGEVLADLGEARAALRDLDRVPSTGRPTIQAARGLALALSGDRDAARQEIQAAIASAPRNGLVLLYAARAVERTDPAGAAALARRAVEAMDPDLSPHHRAQAEQMYEAKRPGAP